LDIAYWIVKRFWIDGDKIIKSDLKLIEKWAKQIKIPTNLERISYKIATEKSFLGYTAD